MPADWDAQRPLPVMPSRRPVMPPGRPVGERVAVVLLCAVEVAMLVVLAGLGLLLAQQTGVTTWPRPAPHVKVHHHHRR